MKTMYYLKPVTTLNLFSLLLSSLAAPQRLPYPNFCQVFTDSSIISQLSLSSSLDVPTYMLAVKSCTALDQKERALIQEKVLCEELMSLAHNVCEKNPEIEVENWDTNHTTADSPCDLYTSLLQTVPDKEFLNVGPSPSIVLNYIKRPLSDAYSKDANCEILCSPLAMAPVCHWAVGLYSNTRSSASPTVKDPEEIPPQVTTSTTAKLPNDIEKKSIHKEEESDTDVGTEIFGDNENPKNTDKKTIVNSAPAKNKTHEAVATNTSKTGEVTNKNEQPSTKEDNKTLVGAENRTPKEANSRDSKLVQSTTTTTAKLNDTTKTDTSLKPPEAKPGETVESQKDENSKNKAMDKQPVAQSSVLTATPDSTVKKTDKPDKNPADSSIKDEPDKKLPQTTTEKKKDSTKASNEVISEGEKNPEPAGDKPKESDGQQPNNDLDLSKVANDKSTTTEAAKRQEDQDGSRAEDLPPPVGEKEQAEVSPTETEANKDPLLNDDETGDGNFSEVDAADKYSPEGVGGDRAPAGEGNTVQGGEDQMPQPDRKSTGVFPEQEDSHFFAYFLTVIIVIILAYLVVHNKQKILGLIVEGRGSQRRRSHSYRKLDSDTSKGSQMIF